MPLTFKSTDRHHPIEFQGFAYEKRASDVSGGVWTVYDETRPQVWRVPLFDELVPSLTVRAPRAGYVVPAAHAGWVAEKLRLHGVRYEVLPQSVRGFPVEEFKAEQASFRPKPYEGRTPVELTGKWSPARSDLPAGSLFVPIAQPRTVPVLHLFEPMAPDSLAAWGFFNASFERKEGMEDYVLEGEARRMLQESPQLRADFTARLTDPEFARSPEARLDFFYRRHPAYDERLDVVPVVKVDASPLAEGAR